MHAHMNVKKNHSILYLAIQPTLTLKMQFPSFFLTFSNKTTIIFLVMRLRAGQKFLTHAWLF